MRKRKEIPARVKLTDCVECKQPFVNPVMDESHEAEGDMWFVVLRCGNCMYVRELLITQARADEFDTDLAAYERRVIEFLKGMMQESMEDYVNRFARALDADAILAEDF
jgi:hypothetical protein